MATTAGLAKVQAADAPVSAENLDFCPMVQNLRTVFDSGKTKSLAWRRAQLENVKLMIAENHEEMTAALRADLGGPKVRGVAEMGGHVAATELLENLDKWTAPQKVSTPFTVAPTTGRSYVRQEAKGVVLIIGPWNFPFELVFHPMAAAIAAGCPVVIKPSEVSANCAAVITRLVEKYMDPECFKVVNGAVAETTALLKEKWDHIFYTGNGAVGRIVLKAAAEHLTPVTLELGGKSPVFVDKSAKMDSVVPRICAFKFGLNAGQICVAPDYVLIHKDREEEFVTKMKAQIESAFGTDVQASPHFGRIVNGNHVKRIAGLIEATQGQVVAGGVEDADASSRYLAPTMIRGAKMGEPLLTEEIFGPALPIVAVDSMEEAVAKCNSICDRPLALYVYSEDQKVTDMILGSTLSGGVSINTSLEHMTNMNMPFGGVGASGCGAYHGKAGFDEFTHRRAVFHQDTTLLKGVMMPVLDKPGDDVYDMAIKAVVTGFLTADQKRTAKLAATIGAGVVGAALLRSRL